jgi:hypothetical protein
MSGDQPESRRHEKSSGLKLFSRPAERHARFAGPTLRHDPSSFDRQPIDRHASGPSARRMPRASVSTSI